MPDHAGKLHGRAGGANLFQRAVQDCACSFFGDVEKDGELFALLIRGQFLLDSPPALADL